MNQNFPEPSADHIAWVIQSRARTTSTSLELYRILKAYPLSGASFLGRQLVGIAFSLWRSAFIADRSGDREVQAEHAMTFLTKMLVDNAITFTQDRNARDWSFEYYLENARMRLIELDRFFRETGGPGTQGLGVYPNRNPMQTYDQAQWNAVQGAFEVAVQRFAIRAQEPHQW